MDLRMPEVDGLDATRAIKRDSPSTVVLVLNGYGDPDLLAEALEAGAAGYIRKSATPKQITNAVREALEGASPVDQGIATQLLLRLLKGPRKASSSRLTPKRLLGGERAASAPPASLTQREVEVLRLIARGHTNRQIARSLFVSVSTVKKHVRSIILKLGVSDRTQAAVKANGLGLLDHREGG
jgi:NarL family two-component system response regulator LiaR